MLKPFFSRSTSENLIGRHTAVAGGVPAAMKNVQNLQNVRNVQRDQVPAQSQSEKVSSKYSTHPIIGFLGAKGGVGATTLAINVAAAISRDFAPVTIVDANLQQPDAAVVLGRASDFTLLELVERAEELTPEIVQACSIPVSTLIPSCRLVSPPPDGEAAIKMHLSDLAQCINMMRVCSPVWLLDLPRHLDRHLVTMLDCCDLVVVVTEPTIASVNATKRWSKVFADLGYPPAKMCLVLNRAGGKITAVEEQLCQFAPFEDVHTIPNAYELSERSVTRGEPVVSSHPRAPLSQAVQKLAADIMARWNHV